MPKCNVETLYSGTEVWTGFLCTRVCTLCPASRHQCLGTKCEHNLSGFGVALECCGNWQSQGHAGLDCNQVQPQGLRGQCGKSLRIRDTGGLITNSYIELV